MMDKYGFIGCESSYEESRLVIFGAPFDGTASYRPGARFGPSAIRNESYGIETYSPYQDMDLTEISVADTGDLELPLGNTERVLEGVWGFARKVLQDGKTPVMLGGEHLVTLAAVKAAYEKYPDLCVVHFDAHTDLRDEYIGEKLSHSTVMRRVYELVGNGRIFQHGIRSGERDEFIFADGRVEMERFGVRHISETVEKLKNRPVYLSVDLDVLDPSELCGTGTPEAGGLTFRELIGALLELSRLNIIGADLCELAPGIDLSGASTALACKLLRELLLLIWR